MIPHTKGRCVERKSDRARTAAQKCIFTYIYVYIRICMYTHTQICTQARIQKFVCLYMCIIIHKYVLTRTHVFAQARSHARTLRFYTRTLARLRTRRLARKLAHTHTSDNEFYWEATIFRLLAPKMVKSLL